MELVVIFQTCQVVFYLQETSA